MKWNASSFSSSSRIELSRSNGSDLAHNNKPPNKGERTVQSCCGRIASDRCLRLPSPSSTRRHRHVISEDTHICGKVRYKHFKVGQFLSERNRFVQIHEYRENRLRRARIVDDLAVGIARGNRT
jgi:hypothetical protein